MFCGVATLCHFAFAHGYGRVVHLSDPPGLSTTTPGMSRVLDGDDSAAADTTCSPQMTMAATMAAEALFRTSFCFAVR
jgi:hypothetical protein